MYICVCGFDRFSLLWYRWMVMGHRVCTEKINFFQLWSRECFWSSQFLLLFCVQGYYYTIYRYLLCIDTWIYVYLYNVNSRYSCRVWWMHTVLNAYLCAGVLPRYVLPIETFLYAYSIQIEDPRTTNLKKFQFDLGTYPPSSYWDATRLVTEYLLKSRNLECTT